MALRTIHRGDGDFESFWNLCFQASTHRHPLYQPENLAYYKALANGGPGAGPIDRSFIVADDLGVAAATRMFSVERSGGGRELSCYATIPVWFFENRDVTVKRIRKYRTIVKKEIRRIIEADDVSRIWYEDPLADQDMSFLGKLLLNMGATASPVVRQVIDLNQEEADMFRSVRKSYKSLINWGKRNLRLTVYDSESISRDTMEQFRALHVQVAGRETRSGETWLIQEKMIKAREAFAVFGELDGDLVTAALFPRSETYCFYGVSASNRRLFDKPLSHAVLWEAILYAMHTGCRFFELGLIQFPGIGELPPTEKELSISTFKHGFGGRSEPRLSIVWESEALIPVTENPGNS